MRLSEDFLMELKARSDIEAFISSYVALKRRGRNLVGLCPFHNEKTPSFTVYPESQSYYCFGCGAGGDVITFLRQIENLDYLEAVRALAERAGLEVPEDRVDDSLLRLKSRVLEANREAARFFHHCLVSSPNEGLRYFTEQRKLSRGTIQRFGLGFAPNSWDSLLRHMRSKGFTEDELTAAYLVIRGKRGGCYDIFRNRVIFPIIDLRGNVIGFGGRVLDDSKPKYLNTSKTPVFDKGRNLFALNFAKNEKTRTFLFCEGYMDVIALHQAGFRNAIASLGTALTADQARVIGRYCEEVVIATDSDEAGRKAADKDIRVLGDAGLKVRVMRITGAKDPDEFIKKYGATRFKGLIEGAANDTEFRLLGAREKYDLESADGRVEFLTEAAGILATLPSPIERDVYAAKLAKELEVSKAAILQQAESLARGRARAERKKAVREAVRAPMRRDTVNPERTKYLRAACAEEGLIALMLRNPGFYEHVAEKIRPEDFLTGFNRRVFSVIMERLRENKLLELQLLSGEFSPEEMGRIVQIQTREANRLNRREECDRCMEVILEEKAKTEEKPVSELSLEDCEKKLEQLKKRKKQ